MWPRVADENFVPPNAWRCSQKKNSVRFSISLLISFLRRSIRTAVRRCGCGFSSCSTRKGQEQKYSNSSFVCPSDKQANVVCCFGPVDAQTLENLLFSRKKRTPATVVVASPMKRYRQDLNESTMHPSVCDSLLSNNGCRRQQKILPRTLYYGQR